MTQNSVEDKILLDSDVIRHFLNGSQIQKLPSILPNRLVILDVVKRELCRSKRLITPVTNFISFFKIEELTFPKEIEIIKEYADLTSKGFGDGESACMAVAKYEGYHIASSNLRDIEEYCQKNALFRSQKWC